jgi:glycogen synthase
MDMKKIVIAAWEIGHAESPCGVKVGGMAAVLQELPLEMADYAEQVGLPLQIEVLSPCFRFYDRSKMQREAILLEPHFHLEFEVFSYEFEDAQGRNIKHIYFWNESLLGNFGEAKYSQSIYLNNAWDALRVYARVSAAMSDYIMSVGCDAIHLHDYHVGMIPFYLDMDTLGWPGLVFTIHNATYQGWLEIWGDPAPVMYEIAMPLQYYYDYFQYWGHFNTLKGVVLRIPELGGFVTTVSEGYAQELCMSEDDIRQRALTEGCPWPKKVFVPSGGLAEFSWLKVRGINNGLAESNRAEHLRYLKAGELTKIQKKHAGPLFRHAAVQEDMLSEDHNYGRADLSNRLRLKELLGLECFGIEGMGEEPEQNHIIFCAVGRLVHQKNFEVLLGNIEPVIHHYPNAHFVILANPAEGDPYGKAMRQHFTEIAERNPQNAYFYPRDNEYPKMNEALGKLTLAASDFCLLPSRFEPCGLVDYEAVVLGNIPIVRKTGGLVKTLPHSYSYSWYDEEDPWGEAFAFNRVLERAIDDYIHYPAVHEKHIQNCLQIDTSWQRSVIQYLRLLRVL